MVLLSYCSCWFTFRSSYLSLRLGGSLCAVLLFFRPWLLYPCRRLDAFWRRRWSAKNKLGGKETTGTPRRGVRRFFLFVHSRYYPGSDFLGAALLSYICGLRPMLFASLCCLRNDRDPLCLVWVLSQRFGSLAIVFVFLRLGASITGGAGLFSGFLHSSVFFDTVV